MEDDNQQIAERETQHFVPGSQFLAGTLLFGAVGYSAMAPPGIEAIPEAPDDLPFDSCDDNAELRWADLFSAARHLNADSFQLTQHTPGIGRLLRLSRTEGKQVQSHLSSVLNTLKMPRSWMNDRVEKPTKYCVEYSLTVLSRLSEKYQLIPYKVAYSKEGAIFAAYRNTNNVNTLRIEIDNDLDAVAVVSDGGRILDSGLLEDDDLEESIIDAFMASASLATVM
jgi:hypothetical protein